MALLLSLPQINPGCDVPPEYYLTNLTETSREEMERIVVGRARTHEVEYSVALPGSVLRFVLWQLGEMWGKNFARSSLLASILSSSSSPFLFLLLSLSPPPPPFVDGSLSAQTMTWGLAGFSSRRENSERSNSRKKWWDSCMQQRSPNSYVDLWTLHTYADSYEAQKQSRCSREWSVHVPSSWHL